jgi:hypothetical protein
MLVSASKVPGVRSQRFHESGVSLHTLQIKDHAVAAYASEASYSNGS